MIQNILIYDTGRLVCKVDVTIQESHTVGQQIAFYILWNDLKLKISYIIGMDYGIIIPPGLDCDVLNVIN